MDIKSSEQFVNFITETMKEVKSGQISPAVANSMAQLAGKLLQMMNLELKAQLLPGLRDRRSLRLEANPEQKSKKK